MKFYRLVTVFVICFTVEVEVCNGATCTTSDNLGNSNVFSLSGSINNNQGTQYFMTDSEYISSCCGTITSWTIYAGITGSITYQVWRPVTGSSATLIGENAFTISSTGTVTNNVNAADHIDVQANDIIGWYTSGFDIVEYKHGGNRNDNNYVEDISAPSVGDTISLSNILGDRTYAIYAQLDALPAPTITNLDDSVSLFVSSIDTVNPVFTVTSSSPSATFSLSGISPSSHFTVNSVTGEVIATTTSVTTTTYTLTISASESCSYSVTGTLTIIISPTAPVWSNLDASKSVSKGSVSTSLSVFTALATNPVVTGPVYYSLQSISPSSDFIVDYDGGNVTANTVIDGGATYTIVIRASDMYSNYVDGTLTLDVYNTGPHINSLPSAADVSESAVDETLLHTINVTDADGDAVTCSMTSSPSGPFTTKYMILNGYFVSSIYLQSTPNLDYSTIDTYEISVTCTDTGLMNNTGTLYIYVTPNNVPVITNLQNTTSILSTTPTSTLIFKTIATDAEEDAMYFQLACVNATPCPFSIFSDGSVTLTFSLISTNTNGYEVDISVYDDYSSGGNHRLVVFVTDLNTQPSLSNLPANIQVTEDTGVGITIFDASVYDEDGDTAHTFTAFFNPSSSAGLFQLNSSTGEITLKTGLNYLTQANNYSITMDVSDAQGLTSTTEILQIEVVDVNQSPILYQIHYQVDVEEGGTGTSAPDPDFNVYDADDDTLTFSWAVGSNTSGFAINTTNGVVSFTKSFDVEDLSVETLHTWLIVIADPEGLSVTATLTLSILDANDNIPKFNSSDYAAVVYINAPLDTTVLRVGSTDVDRTEVNREVEYSIHSTNLFRINNEGYIFVFQSLENELDTIDSLIVRVRNPSSGTYDSANIFISIVIEPDNDGYFDNGANIAWVTLVCVLVPLLLIGLGYLCYLGYQKWNNNAWTSAKVTQVAPKDTRMTPYQSRAPSRLTLATRETAVVTPSDIRVIKESWEGWKGGTWERL